jgi:hypothetical protein
MAKSERNQQREEDDGENLVRQVIAENPVAEVGVREEWDHHIGWHRREHILASSGHAESSQGDKYLRRRNSDHSELALPSIVAQEKESRFSVFGYTSKLLETTYFSGPILVGIGLSIWILSVAAFMRVYGSFRGRKLRSS